MAETTYEMTPLKKKLDEFGTFLSKAIAVICVLVWIINIGHFKDPIHGGWVRTGLLGVTFELNWCLSVSVSDFARGLSATCLASQVACSREGDNLC